MIVVVRLNLEKFLILGVAVDYIVSHYMVQMIISLGKKFTKLNKKKILDGVILEHMNFQ